MVKIISSWGRLVLDELRDSLIRSVARMYVEESVERVYHTTRNILAIRSVTTIDCQINNCRC